MLDDTLRLTLDDIYPTTYNFEKSSSNSSSSNLNIKLIEKIVKEVTKNEESKEVKYISPYPVDNYSNSENLW